MPFYPWKCLEKFVLSIYFKINTMLRNHVNDDNDDTVSFLYICTDLFLNNISSVLFYPWKHSEKKSSPFIPNLRPRTKIM